MVNCWEKKLVSNSLFKNTFLLDEGHRSTGLISARKTGSLNPTHFYSAYLTFPLRKPKFKLWSFNILFNLASLFSKNLKYPSPTCPAKYLINLFQPLSNHDIFLNCKDVFGFIKYYLEREKKRSQFVNTYNVDLGSKVCVRGLNRIKVMWLCS